MTFAQFFKKHWFEVLAFSVFVYVFSVGVTYLLKPDPNIERLKNLDRQLQEIKKSNDKIEQDIEKILNRPVETSVKPSGKTLTGQASVYSENGCLGCDPARIMANGERLDDNIKTVALPCAWVGKRCTTPFKFGAKVRVENRDTGKAAVATFTDTFDGIKGRIADLSLATANAVGCESSCQVKIQSI